MRWGSLGYSCLMGLRRIEVIFQAAVLMASAAFGQVGGVGPDHPAIEYMEGVRCGIRWRS